MHEQAWPLVCAVHVAHAGMPLPGDLNALAGAADARCPPVRRAPASGPIARTLAHVVWIEVRFSIRHHPTRVRATGKIPSPDVAWRWGNASCGRPLSQPSPSIPAVPNSAC